MDVFEFKRILAEEAAFQDELAGEMTELSSDGCGPEFANSLRAIARNHRIRAIELRAKIAALGIAADV